MATEIRVGDRVKHMCHESGTLLGLHTNCRGQRWAWVEWDDGSGCYGCQLFSLTRIEPDVPKAKFSVGQTVHGTLSGHTGVVMGIEQEFHYNCRQDSGFHFQAWEQYLEAIPDCPTCGGKVADG